MAKSKDVVNSIMSRTVRKVQGKQPLKVALARMTEHDIGSMVVIEDGSPIGIITERDIIKELAREPDKTLVRSCQSLASKPLITVTPDTDIWDAFTVMLRSRIRRRPVMHEGKLVGIITERDLFKWVIKVIYEPNLPGDIAKLIEQNP